MSAASRTLGVAVVGSGVIAQVVAAAVTEVEGARLALVVGRRAGPTRALAEAHGTSWSTDPDGWIAAPGAEEVDLVVVTTPSGTHADLVVPLLEAGKHVLVEKPLDVTLEAADRVIEAEARTGRVVGVVSQHRFDRSFEVLSDAVGAGRLGRLTSAVVSCAWWRPQAYYDSAPWRGTVALDGGVVMNQAIHLLDLFLALMGPVRSVHAHAATLAHDRIEVEDTAVATLELASGALAVLHATTAAFPGVEASLRVFGDRGSAAIVDDRLVLLRTEDDPDGAARTTDAEDAGLGPAHARQLADLVDVIRRREAGEPTARPRVGTAEARRALELVLAIHRSAGTGERVELG